MRVKAATFLTGLPLCNNIIFLGDLSLLASAATELDTAAPATVAASLAAAAVSVDSAAVSATTAAVAAPLNPKRRKTLPRKLGSYMSSPARSAFRLQEITPGDV